MRCGNCNYPHVEITRTSVEEWDGGELIVIQDVPVEKCPRCGQEYFEPAVLRALETLIVRRHRPLKLEPARVLQVPVFRYALAS